MRGALLFLLYGGDAWIASGIVIVTIALVVPAGAFDSRPLLARAARAILLVALVFASFSGTPIPLAIAVPLLALVTGLVFLVAEPRRPRLRAGVASATIVLSLLATIPEAAHLYRTPKKDKAPERLLVLGDSLTSGGFGESGRWTTILGERCGLEIRDLSTPSETTRTAARSIGPDDLEGIEAVLVELGGNDMLDDRNAGDFERDLDELFSLVESVGDGTALYHLEFPVLPGKWGFAAVQRRLAQRHGVELIPKRVLAAVLTDPANTFDGLHLNDRGHAELALRVMPWLGCDSG